MWGPGLGIGPIGPENKSKPMNDTQTIVHHPKPPRFVQHLINAGVRTILRSPWHGMMSPRLLLLTFTRCKSGKAFTTPIRYVQEGETLWLRVAYPWWKNLVEEATVRVLLRGKMHTGTAEVLPEEGGGSWSWSI
jgi:F420H(2)-dependent quinone reductase